MRRFLQSCRLYAIFLFAVLVLEAPLRAQDTAETAPKEPVLVTDLLKLKRLGDVSVSPDSREVVYTVTSVVSGKSGQMGDAGAGEEDLSSLEMDSLEYRTHLYAVDAAGFAAPRQLTRGDESASNPAWHPSGDRIAFVRSVKGKPQIFVLPFLGGEAMQITNLESGASRPRWSPDGERIMFSSTLSADDLAEQLGHGPTWPLERPGRMWGDAENVRADPNGSVAEIRAWLEENADDSDPRVIHRLDFLGEHTLEPTPEFTHFFVTDADTVKDPVMITQGFGDFSSAEWLPDGERILVSGLLQGDAHPDRMRDSHLYVASAEGTGVEPFFEMDGYAIHSPTPSPDGQQLAFVARHEEDLGYAQSELGVLPIQNAAAARLLTVDFDRSVSDPQWSKDGWFVYFTAASDGGEPLYRIHPFETPEVTPVASDTAVVDSVATTAAVDTTSATVDATAAPADTVTDAAPQRPSLEIERLTSFERGVLTFAPARGTVFFVATSVSNPYELYSSSLPFTSEKQLTTHNAEWVEDKILSYPERHTLSREGYDVEYWIMKPTAFDSTRRYPLLLEIHGGPSAMWGPGEATMWHEFQFFAAKGYAIVFSNPRGSGGYGYAFKRANYQDWGTGPAEDVLAVATEAAALPWVDPDRQVVTGGSYAGYLTAWIVAHDHRFKAAAAQRGVYDLNMFLGEGNAWRLVPSHFGGYPWDTEGDDLSPEAAAVTDDRSMIVDTTATRGDTSNVDSVIVDTSTAADTSTAPADSSSLAETEDPDAFLTVAPSTILQRNSPSTFVDQIRTPLLIIHADNDLRTGVGQSEVLYRSLKILDRPVEYIRYPEAGHDLSRTGDPKQRMDRILRIYEFFERFIR